MKFGLFLIMASLASGSLPAQDNVFAATEDAGVSGILDIILEMAFRETRTWARPIETVDMERILELLEMGWVTFHEAEWYAVKGDDE